MKNELMMFEGKEIEVFEFEGRILFNSKDVANCLDIKNVNENIRLMNEKQVVKLRNSDISNTDIRKLNNAGENFLTESGVYKLIFKSRKEEAERFQDWISDEVLPSIRQTGAYITNNANPKKLREKASEIEKLQLAYNSTSMLKELLDGAGFDNKSKLLTAKTLYKKAGIDLPIEIDEEEHYFDTKQIASKLKIYSKSNKPAQLAVCEIIKKIKLEENEVKGVWETNGSWTGTVNKYTKSVIDKVRNWIEENNRPTKIAGEKKNYHVVYKIE
ncbi:toxin Bro [Clostridioides difficile]|uniref:BRO-N domain-containing protein n=2 Tax=Clostridioides difficile TaxID=1496 RepID=UPI00038D0BBA|nr:Bro-N domain-containing protein [Clostridioides difficile]EQF29355.1 BRO family, N-terminal domain protein [Clostridioides difficile CD159]EQF30620.1 BRO family, N-terminal domain protein [Clostridioides difficile CD165]EQG13480.1 BRO family, N-terminal domain protein [Clostridioides difficile DA00044]EQG67230.1 BRO family, N-terminal domain protein [Clostridioides difficile DA00160]EQG69082.1 BRO family, N-terminal domain protein [Clostridioides difficile DA00154]